MAQNYPLEPQEAPPAVALRGGDRRAGDGGGAALGTDAKLCSTFTLWAENGSETGEIVSCVRKGNTLAPAYDPIEARLLRFFKQSGSRRLLPMFRVNNCLRVRQAHKSTVEVWKSKEHGSTQYGGLQTCGSVWVCPVCAAKISERRRAELVAAVDQHKANGGQVLLLTLTNPHTATDDLSAMLEAQQKAVHRLRTNRTARALWEDIGSIGTVRAWEVTHGANGWHPHFHMLLFVRAGLDLVEIRSRFYQEWAKCCRLAGLLTPSEAHGVKLHDGGKAADYASKWGIEHEMTKGHIKQATKGATPFDLLGMYAADGDRRAGALFVEYAHAFKGMNQLVWSKGLKALFAIDDRNDEETAAAIEDDAFLLGEITLEEWRVILRFDARADVLEVARHSWEAVRALLDSLVAEDKRIPATPPRRRRKA